MSNSFVKVTENPVDESLILVIGEDGTITPAKSTVQEYLSSCSDATDLQIMQVNRSDGKTMDVTVDTVTYVPNHVDEDDAPYAITDDMDEIARNLVSCRMDHDYTNLTLPLPDEDAEEDELAQTLSMFEGTSQVKLQSKAPVRSKFVQQIKGKTAQQSGQKTTSKAKERKNKDAESEYASEEEEEEESEEDEEEYEEDDDEDDSDFEIGETVKGAGNKRGGRIRKPFQYPKDIKKITKPLMKHAKVIPQTFKQEPVQSKLMMERQEPSPEQKKQTPKKEKKPPKPAPFDNFVLFSTPDIIRRVGGKQEAATMIPGGARHVKVPVTPLKSPSQIKDKRLSNDLKFLDKNRRPSQSELLKERRSSTDVVKGKKTNLDRRVSTDIKKSDGAGDQTPPTPLGDQSVQLQLAQTENNLPAMIADPQAATQNLNLDAAGLDIDQSILDNINSDLISEDILYQVAQSLVDNAELQNAIDKSLNDGHLVLDTSMEGIASNSLHIPHDQIAEDQLQMQDAEVKGTQIVRPDGRIVVIPPIERPTTRSRNRKADDAMQAPTSPTTNTFVKMVVKPADEEPVPGQEMESSEAEEEEEQSDDDPDKLWCICNQPHNNRFMICCDTCEEWYHGKCVNVTKAMGQLMEQEGREWICLYCKDASLPRPMAAARRVRKASRASSDSSSIQKKMHGEPKSEPTRSGPSCIVCGKPSRHSSIYCSDACILKHAQGVEKVVVFERATGKILSGNNAPSAANLDQWIKEHPGFEAVRSTANKPVKTLHKQFTQSKLRIVKNTSNEGLSLAVQKRGINVGVLPHSPLHAGPYNIAPRQRNMQSFKIVSKKVVTTQPKIKLIQAPAVATSPIPGVPKQRIPVPPPKPVVVKEKVPMPQKTPKSRQADEAVPQPKHQENIRENVKKTLCEQLTNRLKMVDDLKLTKDEVWKISVEIESQLYKCFGDTGQKYRIKYRSLMFNIKDIKNQTLWRRICEKRVNPYQLVRLSPDDLASQELALWRERENKHQLDLITKAELEDLGRQKQYVFKTHKGEQVLEPETRPSDTVDTTEVITALNADSTSMDSVDSKKDHKSQDKKSKHNKERNKNRDRGSKESGRSSSRDKNRSSSKDKEHRRRSRSRDRTSRHSRKRSHSREKDKHRKNARHKKEDHAAEKLDKKSKEILEQLVDNKIVPPLEDRLWKHVQQEDITTAPNADSDSDHEPTSTVTIPTPPRTVDDSFNQGIQPSPTEQTPEPKQEKPEAPKISKRHKDVPETPVETEKGEKSPTVTPAAKEFIWKGTINMVDVAQISITAHEVSGDCSRLGNELPPCLDVVGRISPDTVWDYIGKMKCSNSKAISVLRLNATNVEEKMPYIALYSYLSSRNRLGVVKTGNRAVKDFYILPLANQKPIPQALLPLTGPGFEEPRPAMLLGIIVRDKRKRPQFESGSASKRSKHDLADKNGRSYTPPPSSSKSRHQYLPTAPLIDRGDTKDDDMDEPYSPEDSDPDTSLAMDNTSTTTEPVKPASFLDSGLSAQTFEPFANKFDSIPGLEESSSFGASSQEIQRKMEELDQRIAMQKAEIVNMSQNIASSASGDLGTSALASIALPSNLQQILDSIKGIGAVPTGLPDTLSPARESLQQSTSTVKSELTMPLLLPQIGSRNSINPSGLSKLRKPPPITTPQPVPKPEFTEKEKPVSVLGSLSEEDLIRKAAEMLGETKDGAKKGRAVKDVTPPPPIISNTSATSKLLNQPPVPGLD